MTRKAETKEIHIAQKTLSAGYIRPMVYFPVLQNHQYHTHFVLLIYFAVAQKKKSILSHRVLAQTLRLCCLLLK